MGYIQSDSSIQKEEGLENCFPLTVLIYIEARNTKS